MTLRKDILYKKNIIPDLQLRKMRLKEIKCLANIIQVISSRPGIKTKYSDAHSLLFPLYQAHSIHI